MTIKQLLTLTAACLVAGSIGLRAADAKELWDKSCAKCHGADGKGQTTMGKKLKVKDYTDPAVQAEMKDADMIKLTKEGKKEGDKTLMKGFGGELSDDEIKALIAYIRAFGKK